MNNNLLNSFRNFIKTKWKIVLLVVILVFVMIGIIFGYYLVKKEVVVVPIEVPIEKEKSEDELQENVLPEVIWIKYVNSQLGFSIDVPDKVHGCYRCYPKKVIEAPVKVFEDNENDIVYISQRHYYEAEYDSRLRKYIRDCEKIEYSLEIFKYEYTEWKNFLDGFSVLKPFLGWAIVVKTIKNEDELDEFIKENYGPKCHTGDKEFWKIHPYQEGVYDVFVGGETDDKNTNLRATSCRAGWVGRIKLLYFSEKNKVMAVSLGSECTFQTNPQLQPYQCYDEEMINSFRFE